MYVWIGIATVTVAATIGLIYAANGGGRNVTENKSFQVPGAGWVTLPDRFVQDNGARHLVPLEVLLSYGKRSWNIGGNQKIVEALAVGSKSKFESGDEFRKQAAHYLGDADWRGPAMDELEWQLTENNGIFMQEATLASDTNKLVLLAENATKPVWVAAFVQAKRRDQAIEVMRMALSSYSEIKPLAKAK